MIELPARVAPRLPLWVSVNGSRPSTRSSGGFTLVELAVLIIVISVLAAFAVPRFRDSAERTKAKEAFAYLSSLRAAQERYAARNGTYAGDLEALDLEAAAPPCYRLGEIEAGASGSLEDSWRLTLTRRGHDHTYGEYTVTFTQEGFDVDRSSISSLAAINPMQT